ncbi:MAG TPA: ABC transporter permease, partial [Chloroflexota bacterium]|nr:ABC transporter permease [Chloroflexota bacterium]
SLFNLAMNMIAVFVFALVSGISPTVRWLELIPIIGGFVVLATGLGMLLAALYVRFRDVQPIWDVTLQAWFYCSPIMYTASKYDALSKTFRHLAMLNPPGMLLTQMGHAFIDPGRLDSAVTTAGGYPLAIGSVLLIPTVFAVGWWFFTREAPRVAENL